MLYAGIVVVFLLLVTTTTSFRTQRSRQLVLLGASYTLYAAFGLGFLAILVASSIFNFCIGVWLRRRPTLGRLWIGIAFNLALLGFFKSLPLIDSFDTIAMPVGISFWTFQALSYLLDLYHEDDLDPSLTEFCLYMAFWPTVIMGPICRLEKLLPQFRKIDDLSAERLTDGMRRIATGLVMKLVLAQLMVEAVTTGFDRTGTTMPWSGFDVWILAVGFGFQLYFDFAGYSHIVIGAARLIGFDLEENFDSPYLSTTPSIFWTRWHMSLSSWIRDYVFMPLSTVRRETWWRYFALWSSMIFFGLWHGTSLTFLTWGTYQGTLLVVHRLCQQLQRRWRLELDGFTGRSLSWLVTFLSISLGWVAFRANNLSQAAAMYRAVFSPGSYKNMNLPLSLQSTVIVTAGAYFIFEGIVRNSYFLEQKQKLSEFWAGRTGRPGTIVHVLWENRWFWAVPAVTVFVLLALLINSDSIGTKVSPFVYRRF